LSIGGFLALPNFESVSEKQKLLGDTLLGHERTQLCEASSHRKMRGDQ
jgi:hypothetical protein